MGRARVICAGRGTLGRGAGQINSPGWPQQGLPAARTLREGAVMDNVQMVEVEAGRNWRRLGLGAIGVVAVIACAVAGLVWYRHDRSAALVPAESLPAAAPAAGAAAPEAPAHPLEQAAPALPLSPEGADAALLAELSRLSATDGLSRWIRPVNLVRHFVATVDALPRRVVPQEVVVTTPVAGHLMVQPGDGGQVIAADNAKRYLPWVHLLLSLDPSTAASVYRRYYPLLQQAYRDLGYPNGYFNDRLIEVIDDVLEAPQLSSPPRVVQPSVMWRYEDPDLESLSAGQKILLRIGPVSAKGVRQWLAAFRAKIA